MTVVSRSGLLVAALILGGIGAAAAQAPGPRVTPMVAPAVGSMQSDAVKKGTEDAAKRANDAKAARSTGSATSPNPSTAPAGTAK